MCRLGKNSLCRFAFYTNTMSSFEKLVEIFERRGFTGKEAIEKAEAETKAERDFDLERERIKLEQIKQSGMNTGES